MKYVDMNAAIEQHKITQIANQPTTTIKKEPSKKKFGLFFAILALFLIIGMFVLKDLSIFNPVTIAGEITRANLKETDGRINVLLLGSDQRTKSKVNLGSFLTDSILIASIGTVEKNVVLMSLPRDLWVQTPSGYNTKINAVYSYGGAKELKQVVEEVTGVPLHYYAVINFDLFEETINSLGGVDVNVEKTFTDYQYPIEGKENAPMDERYETITFKAGPQKMDGATALKYARSRKGNNGEDTDFARSKRQQLLIMAIKNKALSASTLLNIEKLTNLYKAYSNNVDTDVDLVSAQGFFSLSQQVQFDKVRSIVLDDRSGAEKGGLLYAPEDTSLYGGAYVLIPKAGNYSQLHAYVQKYLFGE